MNWTSFVFDFIENPTSCGSRTVGCFLTVGINDTFTQANQELTQNDTLCAGATTPTHPTLVPFGWARIFVSGLDELENHIGVFIQDFDGKEGADFMYVKGERVGGIPGENCTVAGDEDGDGFSDCADTDCDGQIGPDGENCEAIETTCDDIQDNDGDGNVDCADTDCDIAAGCEGSTDGDCSDGIDNDGDGKVDCGDGGCLEADECQLLEPSTGSSGGGCVLASNNTSTSASVFNFLLPMIVLGFGLRIIKKRKQV